MTEPVGVASSQVGQPTASAGVTITPFQAHYALVVLLLAYIMSFIDRNIMAVLIGPIREDLNITDFQYSLLHGFAFSMFYILLGIPIARLADSKNRKWVISIGIFFWNIMSCMCGLARDITTFFLARIGVGVGEATLSPSAFSMLSDLYPPEKVARAFAVYTLGVTLGGGLSYIIGAWIYGLFEATGGFVIPYIGHVKAWQLTFFAAGIPGFVIFFLLLFVKEPPRRKDRDLVAVEGTSLKEFVAHLRKYRRIYIGVMGANSMLTVLTYGMMAWYPEFLMRTYGMERGAAAGQFGLVFIIAGSLGAIVTGWSVHPLQKRGYQDAPVRVVLVVACLVLLIATLGPLSPTPFLAVLAACPAMFLLNSFYGPGLTALQAITPNQMKAQVTALSLFFSNLFGLALGPSAVAVLTDFVLGDDMALQYSLALLVAIVSPVAIILALQALRPYRELVSGKPSVKNGPTTSMKASS